MEDDVQLDPSHEEQDSHPDPGLDRGSKDQPNQNDDGLTKLQVQLSPRCDLEVKGQQCCPEGGGRLPESDPSPSESDGASGQDAEHQVVHQSHEDLTAAAANHDGAGESSGRAPALVVTQAEECPAPGAVVGPPVSPTPSGPQRPAHQVAPVHLFGDLSSSSDGDMTCCDLLSLRSDSVSLGSETTVSRRSEDEDTRSVTASSLTSLFHRVQLDPLEKAWLRSSALGNVAAQRRLLAREPSLVVKKDFITTALHWAAKQGRQEVVDMMLRSGADVNVRSGYTALHLASIHGHQHVIHALINSYKAKTSVRDYHGKTAAQYWSGCSDVFVSAESQPGGRSSRGRRTQRSVRPSLLLTRSRSQVQIDLEFGAGPQSSSHDMLDLHL